MDPPPKDDRIKMNIFPPGQTLACAAATALLGISGVAPISKNSSARTSSMLLLGLFGVGLSIGTVVISATTFVQNKTPVPHGYKVQKIVRTGIFAHSRNPIYLGMVTFVGSCAILFNTYCGFLCQAYLYRLLDRNVIQKEEQYLEENFGAEYLSYKAKVPRWLLFY